MRDPWGATGSELRLTGVTLLPTASGEAPDAVGTFSLVLDPAGISLQRTPGDPPRRLPWGAVAAAAAEPWPVEGGPAAGAIVTVTTQSTVYRFAVPDGDVATLRHVLDDASPRFMGRAGMPGTFSPGPPARGVPVAGGHPSALGGRGVGGVGPVLRAAAAALLVALAVALVLAQSAGAVHLPFLGSGTGGSHSPGGVVRAHLAGGW